MSRIATTAAASGREKTFTDPIHTHRPRAIATAIGLAIALANAIAPAAARSAGADQGSRRTYQLWPVLNCDDSGAGSLRAVIGSNQTQSGDAIDLSQLTCGTISLSTGAIAVPQADLALIGPGRESLVISAANASRLLDHGSGTLSLEHLTLASGTYDSAGNASGGCVRSMGTIYLLDAALDDCHVSSVAGLASGGAVSATNVALTSSRVSNSSAMSESNGATGGAIAATDNVIAKYSEISGNVVQTTAPNEGRGGGLLAGSYLLIAHSTVDHDDAPCGGAIASLDNIHSVKIVSSTISDNHSDHCAAVTIAAPTTYVANSTIAFNHADSGAQAGLYVVGTNLSSHLTVQSSIVAHNTAAGSAADLFVQSTFLQGLDNLVQSLNGPPPAGFNAVDADPELGPLQWNGGTTKTRALQPGSPAIGVGNDLSGETHDQRGYGYPRTSGPSNAVDIGAFQFDPIFAGAFDT
jgi:hypothetical protein